MSRKCLSIVEYYAQEEVHACGYCKSPDTNFSHGMWAHYLTVHDYQNLIDRGWRRSGSYCYKPTMDQTCCPMYTIKCEVLNFKISKSQKKILKRMTKFLKNELKKDDIMDTNDERQDITDINFEEIPNKPTTLAQKDIIKLNVSSIDNEPNEKLNPNTLNCSKNVCDLKKESDLDSSTSMTNSDGSIPVALKTSTIQGSNNSSNIPCKKAKLLRIERKQKKLLAQGKSLKEIETAFKESKQQNNVKTLEEFFEEIWTGTKKLELKLVRTSPMSSGYLMSSKKSYEVYKKYQNTVHRIPTEKITEQQYTRFLVRSPLQEWTPENGPPQGYGSFHEQYWLDNELIAIGVIDILPSCVSSVYFFYDPEYSFLSLGTFSSLREIYLTRHLNKIASNLKYYYMGFYIHTCPKMRYKARMKPSKLLCPETYVWCDIEPCLANLDKNKYCRFNEDIDAIDEDGIVDINKILILYREIAMPYEIYKIRANKETVKREENELKMYASLVGMKCAQSLLLYRS
ncbi:arginyl-tRNA--protein transferase 1 isoform X1 [Polistes fuscatus]|uniref:arginyl-tRNA--protein transferase 1 isoform X1 n=1 Tax=Polistes fuscatus TaxID=30207 RepID=UPI001CA9485E|nr:arginyl-tRNA--protein transferase 1 isoform X1 [Polistes fuscatus]XP_043490056.1 arginyl-tRNA--protein transferase 1 isoform X1 [Polistes fuscatus]XP_043490057.1 arginyl-tRNA--protein transferase 1 isoform X1 [Polistes fuscatus]XP_043490058.1 arginyl-tRNA--protein transferase 1 isoform X1 [Polistes fuscatus]